jgi:hypothetical protein
MAENHEGNALSSANAVAYGPDGYDESGRGLAALHNLADARGTLELRASPAWAGECGQSSAAFSHWNRGRRRKRS